MNILKNLSPLQKIKALAGSFTIFCLVVYYFSIHPTIEAYQFYNSQQKSMEQAAQAPAQIQQYQAQLASTENSIAQMNYDRAYLFEIVNTFCQAHHLKLSNFHPEQRQVQHQYVLITSPIMVQGNYVDMVALAYHLEYEMKLGHIASSHFQTIKDRKNRKTYLEGTFYLQNVIRGQGG